MKKVIFILLLMLPVPAARAAEPFVSFKKSSDAPFALFSKGQVASLVCDADEYEGVLMALRSLQADIESVTGVAPVICQNAGAPCIIVGSLNTPLIQGLLRSGKIAGKELSGKTEKYILQVVQKPLPGVAQALNQRLAKKKDPMANAWADRVEECFRKDAAYAAQYHAMNGGKWNHMMAEHFTRKTDGAKAVWTVIPELGRTLSGITPQPVTAPVDGMALEYDMEIPSDATARVNLRFCATLNFAGKGLRYAVNFDGGEEQIVDINGDYNGETGNAWHREHAIESQTIHQLSAGKHTLRVRVLDNALVLQKIIVNLGGLHKCCLGPEETLK